MKIPTAYVAGYQKARMVDSELAGTYVEHLLIGDPLADAAIASVAGMSQREIGRLIKAGMDFDEEQLLDAPQDFQDFFHKIDPPPSWFDSELVLPGCRAFNQYSDAFIQSFFVATLQNATSVISKAFYITGRVLSKNAHRRIRQNLRHYIEIMLPHSLERHGDGWKLSVRIRLVHAQIRRLIRDSGEWDESVYGIPINASHMSLSYANFSASLISHAERLGAKLDDDMRRSMMQIWGYATLLMGMPESVLFEGKQDEAARFSEIGRICEPSPGLESVTIANQLVKALPEMSGNKTTERSRRSMERYVYRVSRALLGHEVADQLEFPRLSIVGLLPFVRFVRTMTCYLDILFPKTVKKLRFNNFLFLLNVSWLIDIEYLLPDKLKANESSPW